MIRRLFLWFLVFLAPATLARHRAASSPTPLSIPEIDAIVARANLPGVTVAVRQGNANLVRAYGAETNTIYQIGSITKQFTAAAIMRLAEEGKLSIDDRARKFIPELDSRFDTITIRHLLNHTSGVRAYDSQLDNLYVPKTQQEILALITSGPPLFTPGSQWLYSNSGYFLLGMIIERVSARSYDQFLREQFFAPLGLTVTSYCGMAGPVPEGTIAFGESVVPVKPADMSLVFSAGALCSTASDLVRWNAALASGLAVSPQSYARMINESFVLDPSVGYGFGLVIDRHAGHRRIWHNGAILGFMSYLAWYPDDQLTIAVLVNEFDPSRDLGSEIGVEIAAAIFQSR